MDKQHAILIVSKHTGNKFNVLLQDGSKKDMRLFVTSSNILCEFMPRSRKRGYPIDDFIVEKKWVDIIPCYTEEIHETVKKFMEKCVKYLTASGLWEDILIDYTKILSQGDDYLKHVLSLDYSAQREYLRNTVDASFHVDSIINSAMKGIVSINYHKYEKDDVREKIHDIIHGEKIDFSYSWRKSYDNSVHFASDLNGSKRGWYSEEYKNCGNGHYYLALDERRAIFCEDD